MTSMKVELDIDLVSLPTVRTLAALFCTRCSFDTFPSSRTYVCGRSSKV